MNTYRDINGKKYIVIEKSEYKDKVLGLTTNQMLIVVDSNNKRIDEYQCPISIWIQYLEEIHKAMVTPDYQVCLYFGSQNCSNDDL